MPTKDGSEDVFKQEKEIIFMIMNDTGDVPLDVEKIWMPYYVGEQSRNKKISGTGLGLSIVCKICDTQGYRIGCSLQEGRIKFTVAMSV